MRYFLTADVVAALKPREMDCEYIEDFFKRGFTTDEILTLLAESHGIVLSKRTLERILSKKQLWRRKNKTDVAEVATFIEQQLETSGLGLGLGLA